jgi:hypothetical protein
VLVQADRLVIGQQVSRRRVACRKARPCLQLCPEIAMPVTRQARPKRPDREATRVIAVGGKSSAAALAPAMKVGEQARISVRLRRAITYRFRVSVAMQAVERARVARMLPAARIVAATASSRRVAIVLSHSRNVQLSNRRSGTLLRPVLDLELHHLVAASIGAVIVVAGSDSPDQDRVDGRMTVPRLRGETAQRAGIGQAAAEASPRLS